MFKQQFVKQVRTLATEATSTPINSVNAGIILSRTPIVTPDIPEFDQKFYKYQEELERRLMWTFPRWYYFKKGTVAEREFSKSQIYPIPKHRGVWFPKGVPDIKHGRDRRFKETIILPKKHHEEAAEAQASDASVTEDLEDVARAIKPNSRVTEADESNDQTSLERKLPRTLYLLVNQNNGWKFPSFQLKDTTNSLDEVAEQGLRSIAGVNINTWTVSSTPAAVLKYSKGKLSQQSDAADLTREFLIKSHIIAGKFDFKKVDGVEDYKWLVKEEIEELVDDSYYKQVGHLLSNI